MQVKGGTGLLESGIAQTGVQYTDEMKRQLAVYLSELALWKKKGLVNAQGDELIIRHFLDCIAAFPFFPSLSGWKTADLGSGAGFPGLLAAVFFPDAEIDLVERQSGRAAFLTNCVSLLGLGSRVRVLETGAEDLDEAYNYFLLRAFRPFDRMPAFFNSCLENGTSIIAYKGKLENAEQERALFPDFQSTVTGLNVPFLDEERQLLVIYGR